MVESTPVKVPKPFKNTGKLLALMPSDESLDGPTVISSWAKPEGSVKRIEQVGSGYEKLKKRYADLWKRVKMGASA